MVAGVFIVCQKIIAGAHGLGQDKGKIQHKRRNGDKQQLRRVVAARWCAGGEIGQHQREHQNGNQRYQRGTHRFFIEKLLAVFQATN